MFTGRKHICYIVLQIKLFIVRCFQLQSLKKINKLNFTYQFKVPLDKEVFIHLSDNKV